MERALRCRLVRGDFTRLRFSAEAHRQDEQRITTPEFEQRINTRRDALSARVEVDLHRSLRLFVDASVQELEHLLDQESGGNVPTLEQLDRDEDVVRAGLRLALGARWRLGIGVEDSRAEFVQHDFDPSNEGTAPVVELEFEASRTYLRADIAFRDLEPTAGVGVGFVPFDDHTGSGQLLFEPSPRVELALYGHRDLVYTLGPTFAYFVVETGGLSGRLQLNRRMSLGAFIEDGRHDYAARTDLKRRDDVTSFGADFDFELGLGAVVGVRWGQSETNSSIDDLSRDTAFVSIRFSLRDLAWP